jgi:hypothetical protein
MPSRPLQQGQQKSKAPKSKVPLSKTTYYKNSKCPYAFFRRKPLGVSRCADSEREYARVIQEGGPGISEPYLLGLNMAGSQNIIVPPMQPAEKLFVVDPGRSQADHALIARSAKYLSQNKELGERDINTKQWLDDEGNVLPPMTKEFIGPIFCDNITAYAESVDFLVGFFKAAGFQPTQANGEVDPARGCWIMPCQNKEKTEAGKKLFLFKIGLVGVVIRMIKFIIAVLYHAQKEHISGLQFSKLDQFMQLKSHFFKGQDAVFQSDISKFALMVEYGIKIQLHDVDLTRDLGGTLNSDRFELMCKHNNFTIKEHQCGLNMVRLEPKDVPLENCGIMLAAAKAYNKFTETFEQAAARNQDIACKSDYAVDSCTERMKKTYHDPDYYQNGWARWEVTFSSPDRHRFAVDESAVEDMCNFLNKYLHLVSSSLVISSFDAHILRYESLVDSSIVVYVPEMFKKKRNACIKQRHPQNRKHNNALKKALNKNADAYLIRWYNSATGKANGLSIRADFSSRTPGSSAWHNVAQCLAYCASCGNDPYLMICVRGFIENPADKDPIHKQYYRMVRIQRTVAGTVAAPNQLLTYFVGSSLSGRGLPRRHLCCDWNQIGVDVSTHTNIRPAVLDLNVTLSYYSMGEIDVAVAPQPAIESLIPLPSSALSLNIGEQSAICQNKGEIAGTTSSETKRRVAGFPETTLKLSDLTAEKRQITNWSRSRKRGRPSASSAGSESLFFWLGETHRDKFVVYDADGCRELLELLNQNPTAKVWVWYDPSAGFRWELGEKDQGVVHDARYPKAASLIPVMNSPQTITGAGFKPHCSGKPGSEMMFVILETGCGGNKFFLPVSIRQWLLSTYGKDNISAKISGMRILHPLQRSVRVANQRNTEEALSIMAPNDDSVLQSNHIA